MNREQRRRWVLLILSGLVAGCADEKQVPPPAAQRSAPPPAQVVQRAEPKSGVQPRVAPTTKGSITETPHAVPWPEGVSPQNVFKAFPSTEANFTIGEASGGPHPDDRYVAVRPRAGGDSSAFTATPPDWATQRGTDSNGVRLPSGFAAVEVSGFSSDGRPRQIRCEADGATMSYVPGGTFIQGMDGADPVAGPAHPADVDSFYIDTTEVTVGQYKRFLELGAESADRPPQKPANANAPDNHPALGLAWGDALAYCAWAGKGLPTESEWELAARGPRSFVHPWGDGRAVWERRRVSGQIDAVRSFGGDRSVYDVFDMAGNAREWVSDFFHPQAYEQTKGADGSVIRNWTGPKRPSPVNHKVVKGGGPSWELWHRGSASMRNPEADVGFRCVLRVPSAGNDSPAASNPASPTGSPSKRSNGL